MHVAILGCGYVGLELARQLTRDDHEVVGVRRSSEGCAAIEDTGATAIQGDITEATTLEAIPSVDAVVFAASSGGRDADAAEAIYVDGLQTVLEHVGARSDPPDRLLYTASTGVYGDHGGDWVDETTPLEPTTAKTAVLAEAERIALEHSNDHGIDGTVARLGGIYGPDRYGLERYLEHPVTEGYRNIIHRDDAAGAIRHLLTDDHARDDTVLVVDDEPTDRWTFADWLAGQVNEDPPRKLTAEERLAEGDLSEAARRRIQTSKRCANNRLRETGYELAYPSYREGYRAAIDRYRAVQSC